MSTLSKETTETLGSSIAESAASPVSAQPQSQSPTQIHSDAVSLEVPLKVHGSKVTEAVRGASPRTEPFEEQASSMIVFPNGGVLRMATSVNTGQMLVLTNLKSRQDAICRVVKVRNYSGSSSYVEVEFTHRQPGFWGVYFESDASPVAAASPASTAQGLDPQTKVPQQPGPSVFPAYTVRAKNESLFIGIGSQEDVQLAATLTSSSPSNGKVSPASSDSKSTSSPGGIVSAQSSAIPALSVSSSQSKRTQEEEEDASVASEHVSDTTLREEAAVSTSRPLTAPAFGSLLTTHDPANESQPAAGQKNWVLIAACAVGLLAVTSGAALLLHHKSPDTHPAQAQASSAPPVAPSENMQPSTPQPETAQSTPRASFAAPSISNRAPSQNPAKAAKELAVVTESPAQPEAVPDTPAASVKKTVPSVFGTLNAHPISSRQVSNGVAAPSVEAASQPATDALLGIAAPAAPSALPPPGFKSGEALPVGGRVGQPRVLSTSIPEYPPLAKQSHTQGDVNIEIVVDKSGNVTEPKVISGPVVLRQAAIDAVRRWRYEPSTLDGQAISVKMLVTIQFRL